MAATKSTPLHPVNAAMLHDLLSDSQDVVGVMDESDDRSRKAEELSNSESKQAKTEGLASVAASAGVLVPVASRAASTVRPGGSQAVVPQPVRVDIPDVNLLMQRMAQFQQEAIQGQLQLQQNLFDQFV